MARYQRHVRLLVQKELPISPLLDRPAELSTTQNDGQLDHLHRPYADMPHGWMIAAQTKELFVLFSGKPAPEQSASTSDKPALAVSGHRGRRVWRHKRGKRLIVPVRGCIRGWLIWLHRSELEAEEQRDSGEPSRAMRLKQSATASGTLRWRRRLGGCGRQNAMLDGDEATGRCPYVLSKTRQVLSPLVRDAVTRP
jgi:hypothetical protein